MQWPMVPLPTLVEGGSRIHFDAVRYSGLGLLECE